MLDTLVFAAKCFAIPFVHSLPGQLLLVIGGTVGLCHLFHKLGLLED